MLTGANPAATAIAEPDEEPPGFYRITEKIRRLVIGAYMSHDIFTYTVTCK